MESESVGEERRMEGVMDEAFFIWERCARARKARATGGALQLHENAAVRLA